MSWSPNPKFCLEITPNMQGPLYNHVLCCQSKKEVAPAETKEAQADELTGLHPPPSPRPPPALPVGEEDPVYDDGLVERVPDKFREWNLEKLVHNRMELQHFREYLAENYARSAHCFTLSISLVLLLPSFLLSLIPFLLLALSHSRSIALSPTLSRSLSCALL